MAYIENIESTNWPELQTEIDEFTNYDRYIFRGQGDAEWPVESTLTRAFKRLKIARTEIDSKVKIHLQQFKEHVRGRSAIDLRHSSEEDLWSLGQHYGLFTPLLDWSHSPYVALYFSLLGSNKSGTRALYALLDEDVSKISTTTSKVQLIKPLSHENPRIVSQSGLFLNLSVGIDLVNLVEKASIPEQDWVTLYKITYPEKIRNDVLAALNRMNINHASLFPDLFGSSLHSNFLLEIEPHLERGRAYGTHKS